QGLPFYGGEVSYHIPVSFAEDAAAEITVPHYSAAVNTVAVDGERKAVIAYPPYRAELGRIEKGEHTVTVTSYISRRNCFGDVHNADEKFSWQGPSAWVTKDSLWTYEYRLRRTGIISTPILSVLR
ncbi:MAG: hypothetical protein IKM27_06215, partial [Clostridia bacterium]|nr:hypothetical protein [Clostridia bacterium]